MLHLELLTGLRRGELLALEWNNISLSKGYLNVCQTVVNCKDGCKLKPTTKSHNERKITLNPIAINLLKEIQEKDSKEGFLFKGLNGDFLKLRTYHDRYRKYYFEQKAKYPDLEYLTGHKLRHTFATFLLQCGSDIETVRSLLGHSSISTTQIYVHTDFEQMMKATNTLNFSSH
ncbi:MAG: site-specific integrase [Oscillospiraceae bacterium]